MDFNFSKIQLHWRDAAFDFVRSYPAPTQNDFLSDSGASDWLRQAVIDARDAGIFDSAQEVESGGVGLDLLALCLIAEELVRLDTGLSMAFLNRSLCYRAGSACLPEQSRQAFSRSLRAMPAPFSAVLIWPDRASAGGTTVAQNGTELRIDEIVSLAQPDTTVWLGWTLELGSAKDSANGFFCASGAPLGQAIEPLSVEGFRTLPLHRVRGTVFQKEDTQVSRPKTTDLTNLRLAAGAERALLFAAAGLGLAQVALDYAIDYTRGRMSFDKPLCQHQAIALRVADTAIRIKSARVLLWAACGCGPLDQPDPREAADCWNYCARVAAAAASWSCQLLGGHGFLTDHPLASWLRDIHLVRLLGGQPLEWESDRP